MKKIFTATLIFLFLSCSNSSKHISDNDYSAENPDTDDIDNIENIDDDTESESDEDIETVEDNDIEPDYDTEITDDGEIKADEDEENTEDENIEPFIDPCLEEPCKNIENSTGNCIAKGKTGKYVCVCDENHVWFPNKKICEPENSFKGLSCTGQTQCYDNEKEIPCPEEGEPFFGQDANYAEKRLCLPQNFTIKHYGSDKTVIDNNSGLEWVLEVFNNKENKLSNTDNEAIKAYSDWRNPSSLEYNSIIDSGTFAPTINEAYFPDTPSGFFYTESYISETPYRDIRYIPPSYTITRGMDFKTGLSDSYSKDNYSSSGDRETNIRRIRDTSEKTGSCNFVFSSDDYKIVNFPKQRIIIVIIQLPEPGKNWEESLEYCENLTYAGISDWHLTNRNEVLFSLSSEDKFVDSNYYFSPFWTSTSYFGDPTKAIGFLNSNYIKAYNKTAYGKAVSCIALDPCPGDKMWTGEKCLPTEGVAFQEGQCGCKEGYELEDSYCIKEEYIWEDSQWVKRCSDDLCKDKAHSTGVCLKVKEEDGIKKVACRCAENYFLDSDFECINPCDADPCSGKEEYDGSCFPTGLTTFTCGCSTGYYVSSKECVSVTKNDCYVTYSAAPCINSVSAIIWSSTSGGMLKWDEASQYCENLEEAGYTDWRLPKAEELWTFAQSCNNIPKESCETSESNGCLSEECIAQCQCKNKQNSDSSKELWSSSFKSANSEEAVVFSLQDYSLQFRDIKTNAVKVKCVRNIE